MYLGLKVFTAILAILSIFFTGIGIYALDASLIIIGVLFAVSILLIVLEAQNQSTNPFIKR
ncbi:hypothetical protein [Acinetobacter sp.]|jgi:hypothetical protein|uniref:Uncharacterized protein n=1 Tax=Acinetobacter bereziniae TaxID=106648 RepID=A0A833PBH9_ACIBZ|nr:hypothetical protein [Acinetobacter sp.]KAF1016587.1 MAG: hypothetical protein GAK29_04494 [Acinetobacter bereziniae]MDR0236662.1 hypothetical protein [Acinetobacter sp.]